MSELAVFDAFLNAWNLAPDGDEIVTPYSRLLPVRAGDRPAMLKLLLFPEERAGSRVLQWWAGDGAARVLEISEDAVLLERAMGTSGRSLRMVASGDDAGAARILAAVVNDLHHPRSEAIPTEVVPLERWFRALWAREGENPVFQRAAGVARGLLADPMDEAVLHGDIHHGNVLDFGERGWLVIDPKGLLGERAFDFANVFRNPPPRVPREPGRMARLATVLSEETGIPEERLLRWVVAFCGLSLAWAHADDDELEGDRVLGEMAAALLGM